MFTLRKRGDKYNLMKSFESKQCHFSAFPAITSSTLMCRYFTYENAIEKSSDGYLLLFMKWHEFEIRIKYSHYFQLAYQIANVFFPLCLRLADGIGGILISLLLHVTSIISGFFAAHFAKLLLRFEASIKGKPSIKRATIAKTFELVRNNRLLTTV